MTKIETERLILREMTPEDFDTELQLKSLKKDFNCPKGKEFI